MTSPEGREPAPRGDEVGAALATLAVTYAPRQQPDEVIATVRRKVAARRHRRIAIRSMSAVAGSAAVIVALVLLWPNSRDQPRRVRTGTGRPVTTTRRTTSTFATTAPVGTTAVPPIDPSAIMSPLAWRSSPAVVSTGYEVVVWGGRYEDGNAASAVSDGAVLKDGRWTPMAAAPISGAKDSLTLGAWTGANVLFVADGKAAVWNGDNSWDDVADPPPVGAGPALVQSGGRIVLVGADRDAAWSPTERSWRLLPDRPFQLTESYRAAVTSLGSEGFALFGKGVGRLGLAGAVWHEPKGRWELLTSDVLMKFDAQAPAATWTGREIVLVNYNMQAAAFDLSAQRWRALPNLPIRFYECEPQAFHLDDGVAGQPGKVIASLCGGMAVRSDAGGDWTTYRLPRGVASFTWGGEVLLGVGYTSGGDLPQPGDRLTLVPWAVPPAGADILVGATGLSLEGLTLVGQQGGYDNGIDISITAEVRTAAGASCTVSSTYNSIGGQLPKGPRLRIAPLAGQPFEMVRAADGSLALAERPYDLLEVRCAGADGAAVAQEVARRLRPPVR